MKNSKFIRVSFSVVLVFVLAFVVSGVVFAQSDNDTRVNDRAKSIEPISVMPVSLQFGNILRVGSDNENVRQLQVNLKRLGYFPAEVSETGFFGSITEEAVRKFQIARSIPVSGIADSVTLGALMKTANPARVSAESLVGTRCLADWNNDGLVDTRDLLAFLNAWSAKDISADINRDNVVDHLDFGMFVRVWNQGCPAPNLDKCSSTDFNKDNVIDTRDLTSYLNAWTLRDISADMNGNGSVEQEDFQTFLDLWKECSVR
ncbi:MAG: GC-type dockerin domain-anchored protein [Candidatus Paceibacterota bacterium]|nr:MAG: GC-type dockerin domain-anchored protein [Candidatus Paceibacterota bacterium]